jgi:hypothetical protein
MTFSPQSSIETLSDRTGRQHASNEAGLFNVAIDKAHHGMASPPRGSDPVQFTVNKSRRNQSAPVPPGSRGLVTLTKLFFPLQYSAILSCEVGLLEETFFTE